MSNLPQNTGQAGINLIKEFEGLELSKYRDAVGLWTIGYGHLIRSGETFERSLTEQEAEALLRKDLLESERGIRRLVSVPLTQNQFDALVSFVFNVGVGRLATSTLLKKLNAQDYRGAADELPKWNKAGGNVLPGLTRRRQAERALFNQ
ncbi:lysozyme [Leminorella grimontii]|uniref:Lysozyme n=1 Tax=Leminorella grimontii TaxID=82981 RepID=A0AAV5MZP4_9GAMM|nr:lysozyme [Leminorella grimontii]KFC95445.1 phage lysozyme [Leminorella grimontii ATCC 33999 = DSM 5078]GKX53986.1 lysozyme [Leminorella grimontii]VFS60389.1 Phage-related lysozyme (muraminidase) [Leminorella grimontii]